MDYFQRIPFNYLVVLGDVVIVILACLLMEEVRKKKFQEIRRKIIYKNEIYLLCDKI